MPNHFLLRSRVSPHKDYANPNIVTSASGRSLAMPDSRYAEHELFWIVCGGVGWVKPSIFYPEGCAFTSCHIKDRISHRMKMFSSSAGMAIFIVSQLTLALE